ncbi:MAG: ABC transporter permease [Edaphocola sp.]
MPQQYSQLKAFGAVTKAALLSIAKSPSSVVFTLAFPLIFILVFGFLGKNNPQAAKFVLDARSDTANAFYHALAGNPTINFVKREDAENALKKGSVSGIVTITKNNNSKPPYQLDIRTSTMAMATAYQLKAMAELAAIKADPRGSATMENLLDVKQTVIESRNFSTIDFILPGQLGFSLLAASVFGTAFVFFNLRQQLVLKRFFATPIKRSYIILAEATARMIFQLLGAVFIILVGHYAFHYTLANGWLTVVNMLVVCALALLVFMSFGFIISGLAKSESTIPPLSNMLTLPQFLLAGTFFSIDAFPKWMQPVSNSLPLTYFNNALRSIAFDGASLWDVRTDIGVLLLWGAIGYVAAAKAFRWE